MSMSGVDFGELFVDPLRHARGRSPGRRTGLMALDEARKVVHPLSAQLEAFSTVAHGLNERL